MVKKKLFLIFLFLFLFLSPKNFLVNNVAEALSGATGLSTSTSCDIDPSTNKNTNSSIKFTWYVQAQQNISVRFWKTGDASETTIDRSGDWDNLIQASLPYNKSYDWYIKVHDTGFCIVDCDKTVNGPSVTSQDCTAAQTCTPTDSCSSKNWSCGNFSNSCGLNVNCGDCAINSGYCDQTTHKCTPTVTNNNNCAIRDRACTDLLQYPQEKCTDFGNAAQWNCPSPGGCPMTNSSVSPTTHSCALSKDYICNPTAAEGDTCYTLGCAGPVQGTCKDGLFCDRTGASSLDPGTCKKIPTDWGTACYTCPSTASWVGTPTGGSCVDKDSGKAIDSSSLPHAYCNISTKDEACVQGTGCIATKGGGGIYKSGPFDPPPPACEQSGSQYICHTAIGDIQTSAQGFVQAIMGFVLSIAGGIAILLIIISGYRLMVSQGNPEGIKNAKDQLTAAIIGLLFVIFSLVILQIIGYNILGLPGFKP